MAHTELSKGDIAAIRAICSAQIASDAGKGIRDLPDISKTAHTQYAGKTPAILRAIKLVNSQRQSAIHYYVEPCRDQNGYESILVYFDIKVDNNKYQVSFHNPMSRAGELKKFLCKGRKTRWHKNLLNSRETCALLIEKYLKIHII